MDKVYTWDRDDKLFAIQVLKNVDDPARNRYLLQLIVDDDPVVRGKAALAMKSSPDEVLLEAVDGLLEQDQSETTILACELLNFTKEVDFSDRVEPILRSSDPRVVRSAIETLPSLPNHRSVSLLEGLVEDYDPEWKKSLTRVLPKIRTPELSSILETLYPQVDDIFKARLLVIGANLGHENTTEWVQKQLGKLPVSDSKKTVIEWLIEL